MTEKKGFWIGLVLACMGIIAPMLWDMWSKKTDLTVEVITVSPIINNPIGEGDLSVAYAGARVDSAYQFVVKISNTGRTPISNAEIITPIKLSFDEAKVLTVKLVDTRPKNITPVVSREENSITVSSELLNPGDFVTIGALVQTKSPKIAAEARIKGLAGVTLITPDHKSTNYATGTSALAVLIVVLVLGAMILEVLKARRRLTSTIESLREQTHPLLDATSNYEALKIYIDELKDVTDSRAVAIREAIERSQWPLDAPLKAPFSHTVSHQVEKEPNLIWLLVFAVMMGLFTVDLIQKLRILLA